MIKLVDRLVSMEKSAVLRSYIEVTYTVPTNTLPCLTDGDEVFRLDVCPHTMHRIVESYINLANDTTYIREENSQILYAICMCVCMCVCV